MTIRDLEIFVEVVRTKNMSQAAKNLSISQPTVSHAISQIEKEYSVKLFDRVSKKLYLTDVSLKLFDYAMELIEKFDQIILFLQSSSKIYDLNLGLSSSFSSDFLKNIVFEYEKLNPMVQIRTSVKGKTEIIKDSRQGFINLGIVEGDIAEDGCQCYNLYEDKFCLIVNKNHRLANKKEIDIKDINGEKFVLGEFDDEDRKALLSILRDHEVIIDLKFMCLSNDMVLNIVKSGQAISFFPKFLSHFEDLVSIPIKNVNLQRSYKAIVKKDRQISQVVEDFIDFTKEKLNEEI